MCRLLCIKADHDFDMEADLATFAEIAKHSREYQGHGWGCAWLQGGEWKIYRNIKPIWEDKLERFGRSSLLIAHARSAFRDEGICVENNMPFFDGENVFVFNGELRGVRIKEQGRIGAEKVFNYIKRFGRRDMLDAIRRAVGIIENKTRYVRAMNMIIASKTNVYLSTLFNEDAAYFQMWTKSVGGTLRICSEPYPGETLWRPADNRTIRSF